MNLLTLSLATALPGERTEKQQEGETNLLTWKRAPEIFFTLLEDEQNSCQ